MILHLFRKSVSCFENINLLTRDQIESLVTSSAAECAIDFTTASLLRAT